MIQRPILFVAAIILTAATAYGKPNDWYSARWCESVKGEHQVRMTDGTIADCVTSDTVYEVEFAKDHYQGIGQSLHYAAVSKKKPGLVIVVRNQDDERHYKRVENSILYHDLKIELVKMITVNPRNAADRPASISTETTATIGDAGPTQNTMVLSQPMEKTTKNDINSEDNPPVKLSKSGICHDEESSYYHRTKHFRAFNTIAECLATGARLPKN